VRYFFFPFATLPPMPGGDYDAAEKFVADLHENEAKEPRTE